MKLCESCRKTHNYPVSDEVDLSVCSSCSSVEPCHDYTTKLDQLEVDEDDDDVLVPILDDEAFQELADAQLRKPS